MTLHEKMAIADSQSYPWKLCLIKYDYVLKADYFRMGVLYKWFLHFWPENGFKGTVVNRYLCELLIEIMLTLPLRISYIS